MPGAILVVTSVLFKVDVKGRTNWTVSCHGNDGVKYTMPNRNYFLN